MDNNNNNRVNVTTRNMSLTNGFAKIPSALEVTYWNDMVKLVFSPELPESKRTETRRYDYDNQWTTCISRMKCNELYKLYEEILVPAMKEKKQKRVSVPIAGVNLLSVDTGVDLYNDGDVHPYIELTKNIDPETLKSDTSIMYEFAHGEYILDHNPKSGEFAERVITTNECDVFMKDLVVFREACTKSFVHAARCVDRAYKDNISNSLRKIGEKVGADLSFMSTYSREGMGHGSIFDKSNGGNGNAAPRQQFSNIDDLDELPFD